MFISHQLIRFTQSSLSIDLYPMFLLASAVQSGTSTALMPIPIQQESRERESLERERGTGAGKGVFFLVNFPSRSRFLQGTSCFL
ncbi:hypothetical protein OIU84_023470 [Salix udensis]|uniref:Uncharacterized protein n=1 Tax=Salix udensis TaxID=889485 RepID=A0AAD6KR18_9ROSI|nr:hypothetical protein OIU84_023470 [Salix udensis]